MKLSARLRLLVFLPILFGAVTFMIHSWSSDRITKAQHDKEVSETIIRHVLELEILLSDFIRHPEQKRAQEQWIQKHKHVNIFLSGVTVSPQNKEAFDHIYHLFITLRQLFTNKTWKLRSAEVTGNETYLKNDRIFDVMLLSSHQLVMEALAFGKRTTEKVRHLHSFTEMVLLMAAAGMTVVLGIVAYFIGSRILNAFVLLKEGSSVIGTGNLEYRFENLGKDEIGDLGKAFNAMTEKLKTITASRDELDREIIERKEAEKRLQQNSEYLKKILDSQSNIVVINENEQLVDANKAFFDFFPRYDSVESFRKEHACICELFETVERPGFLQARNGDKCWIDVLNSEPDILHKAMIQTGGQAHIFTVHYEPLSLGTGKNIVTFSDITELETYQHSLEEKVKEEVEKRRQKEVQMLRQSKIAQMGEMITNISHHWRQPLNIIGLNVQELRDAQRFGELTEPHLEEIVSQTMTVLTKMSATLDQFREFVAAAPQKSTFTGAHSVQSVLELMMPAMESHFIQVETRLDESVELYGDKNLLGQVLYNILHNAQEILVEREPEEKKIELILKKVGATAHITISDTGGGIDAAVLPRIFDPFFTTKERANKTGTGLYFAKSLIESEFGGAIKVSNMAKGASFTILLPLNNPKEEQTNTGV